MTLTQLAVRYRPATYLLTLVLLGVGVFALFALPRREDPDLSARFAQVIALYPGASAVEVEQLVTLELERTFREIDDVETVTSTSRAGVSVLTIESGDRAGDLDKLMDDLRERAADARAQLPAGVASVVVNDRFADTAAVVLGVTWPGATNRERETVAKTLRDRLRRLPDVAEARLIGEPDEVVTVALSSQRLAQLDVAPSEIGQAIARRNVLPESGGSLPARSARLPIAPTGSLTNVRDLQSIVVARSPSGAPIYLRDVTSSVTRGEADPAAFVLRVNGQPAVGVSLSMRKGRNISALGAKITSELAAFGDTLPPGARVDLLNDLPRSVARRMNEFFVNLGGGVALIFVVMYLFMGLRSALIVGALLPATILGTFAAMMIAGRDIQQMSIAALIIALGLVVDNSIVVIDNIEKKMREGIEREQAAVDGTDELRVPLLTANLTTIASFAPLMFLSGGVGEFVRDLGVVTALATVVSLLLNYTLTPLIALRFLRPGDEEKPNVVRRAADKSIDGLRSGLGWLAARGLRRPGLTVGLAVLALVVAFANVGRLGSQFFPSAERDQFTIDVWLPEGRDLRATEKTVARVEEIVTAQTGVRSLISYVGQGGPRFYYNVSPEAPAANYAQIVVNTRSIADTKRLVVVVQRAANETIAEARVTARTLEQGPPVGAPIAVRLAGQDVPTLRRLAAQVKGILNETPGASSVHDSFGEIPLGLKVSVNEDRAALLGLSSGDIAEWTRLAFSGQTVSFLRDNDKEIPIDLRLDLSERTGAASLLDLYLPAANGAGSVPLRQVATVSLEGQDGRIVRRNGVRTLTVSAFGDGVRLPSDILADARARLDKLTLPAGITLGYGGEQEEVGKSFAEMLLIFGLSIAANLLIIVCEFNAFRIALAVMAAVPFGITGAIAGLFLSGQPFGFMAFLGITSLGGVVTNHAIVLFEYALAEQRNGRDLSSALVVAGRSRLRPILLTVVLSIGGLIPQAVNGGNLWPPMAWALIAGLSGSLVLTLVVVPSVYALLSGYPKRHG